ncbi:polysaccharide deacetylase family protein [Sediminibacterium soli]|uniref:polysaccharide deacetylase family protein n=1 Tax=Sediminibacterium soli TaxID=2698829 RepID=UPI00137AFD0A|nr:polysaccharide deacetylase family protein [Sediminibacterium soli]NCI45371.1 hypothetical protein [Sediminibacterium soli]
MNTDKPVWIFAKEDTPRLSYTCSVFFDNRFRIVTSRDVFEVCEGPRINYSDDVIGGVCRIVPHGLLSEKQVSRQAVVCFDWDAQKVFFKTEGDIPFDIFAAAFYLLSRYEEYLPHEKDKYGRYAHTNSLAYREGFLNQPLVNTWMELFYRHLRSVFPAVSFPRSLHRFCFLPTYDVDIAYSYLGQPVWKNVAGFFLDLVKGKTEKLIERGNVYSGKQPDPFDTFSWLDALHAEHRLQPLYFLLTILKRGAYDKNLPAASRELQRLYRGLADRYATGLHPSWQSGTDTDLLVKEKKTLETVTGRRIITSRNHYLRFNLPQDYRRLTDAGITADHSMAYGTVNGFRASYALPYHWYDLEKETVTPLVIHPFCFMEACSFFEQGYNAAQAREELQYYHDTVKKVNGLFITLFHNHFLTEQPEWVQWRDMYADFLRRNFRIAD